MGPGLLFSRCNFFRRINERWFIFAVTFVETELLIAYQRLAMLKLFNLVCFDSRKFIPAPLSGGGAKNAQGGGEKKSRALRARLKVTDIFFAPPSGKISPPP